MAASLWVLSVVPVSAATFQPNGRAAVLIDGASGQVLYQNNAQVKNYPASTTKLLTAVVAVEHGKLNQMITVSPEAVALPPGSSSCYLEAGEQETLETLLTGLLLVSGNDCANAIAEGVADGHADQFVAWMNETARRIGATHSHFVNPHGLHDPDHYTTATDLALIGRAALSNETIRRIASKTEFFWPGKSELNGTYYNHNPLLGFYQGLVGGKNGYTEEAGLTLVESAERDGRSVVAVVMGEPDKTNQNNDMINLLDMGFDNFEKQSAVVAGKEFGNITVTGGVGKAVAAVAQADFAVAAPKGGKPTVTVVPKLNDSVAAPVTSGQTLGTLEVRDGDRLLGTVPLVAEQAVAVRSLFGGSAGNTMHKALVGLLTGLKWLLYLVVVLLLFRFTVKTVRRVVRRSRRRAGFSGSGVKSRAGAINSVYRVKD
jgi:D-alanyl-D-alanine carboxypeptidase (penicillin-binding protein 5/6)